MVLLRDVPPLIGRDFEAGGGRDPDMVDEVELLVSAADGGLATIGGDLKERNNEN